MLDSNKKYPLLSLQRRQEGTPIVEFTILQSGDVVDLKITSSGFRLLDREAQKITQISALSAYTRISRQEKDRFTSSNKF